jgi:hypothetical protein
MGPRPRERQRALVESWPQQDHQVDTRCHGLSSPSVSGAGRPAAVCVGDWCNAVHVACLCVVGGIFSVNGDAAAPAAL